MTTQYHFFNYIFRTSNLVDKNMALQTSPAPLRTINLQGEASRSVLSKEDQEALLAAFGRSSSAQLTITPLPLTPMSELTTLKGVINKVGTLDNIKYEFIPLGASHENRRNPIPLPLNDGVTAVLDIRALQRGRIHNFIGEPALMDEWCAEIRNRYGLPESEELRKRNEVPESLSRGSIQADKAFKQSVLELQSMTRSYQQSSIGAGSQGRR